MDANARTPFPMATAESQLNLKCYIAALGSSIGKSLLAFIYVSGIPEPKHNGASRIYFAVGDLPV